MMPNNIIYKKNVDATAGELMIEAICGHNRIGYIRVFDIDASLLLKNPCSTPVSLSSTPEGEIYVAPAYRRKGIFNKMYQLLRANLNCSMTATFSDRELMQAVTAASQKFNFLYGDLMLELDREAFVSAYNNGNYEKYQRLTDDFSLEDSSANSDLECFFSEDLQDYLLYIGDDEEPAAVLCLDYQDNQTFIYDVVVDENMRGQGLGSVLVYNLLLDYFEDNKKPLLLHVTDDNTAALKLYEGLGFSVKEGLYNCRID